MRRLCLLLPLALALACEIKIVDDADTAGSSSAGESSQGSSSGDATGDSAATEPVTTTTASDPTSSTTTADPTSATTTTADPSATDPSTTTTGAVDVDEEATQLCVDTINMYRATLGLPPLARWKEAEDCADAECASDGMTGIPHGAFGMCGEFAQNECPGWPGDPATLILGCLEQMWNEGPGEDFNLHGHYINMSNPAYTKVACGFAPGLGGTWAVQNFQ